MYRLVLVFLFLNPLFARAESWKIATLEWPPYTCSQCYKNGAAAEALRQVLKKEGITVEFVFYPWVQAQKNGGKRSFVGYFPSWKEEILPGFKASEVLFKSPVVFMERKEKPLYWNSLQDLKGKTFAVTEGYGNTIEFNQMIKDGQLKTSRVLNEESTIRKLIAGSVDGVLIDLFVGKYYLNKIFSVQKSQLALNEKVVENKELYFAFNEASLQKAEVLNRALRNDNYAKSVQAYLRNNFFDGGKNP